MKRILAVILLAIPLAIFGQNVKTFNYYLNRNPLPMSIAEPLSKYQVLILDMEHQHKSLPVLQKIRQLNPNIKIFAYMTVQEIENSVSSADQLRTALKNGIKPDWYLKNSAGSNIVFWTGTKMLNCTAICPVINGQNWSQYFADFITTNVLSNEIWDGFFADNLWTNPNWLKNSNNNFTLDCDNNFIADTDIFFDTEWQKGMRVMLEKLRNSYPNKILVGNFGSETNGANRYFDLINGAMLESFQYENLNSNHTWIESANSLVFLQNNAVQPRFTFINSGDATPTGNNQSNNYARMRFGLSTALFTNSYFSFDYGPSNHGQCWFYDEYNAPIGTASENIDIPQTIIVNDDYNNGSTTLFLENYQGSTSAVYNGTNSLNSSCIYANSLNSTNQWNLFLRSQLYNGQNATYFPLPPNKAVRIRFRYAVESSQINNEFYLNVCNQSAGQWLPNGTFAGSNETSNEVRYFDRIFSMGNYSYNLEFGQKFKGSLWFDDLKISLIENNGLFIRNFTNGIAIINPTSVSKSINLAQNYYHLNGNQDPVTNNGQVCNSVTIPPHDGLILLSNPAEIETNPSVYSDYILNNYPNPFNNSTNICFNLPKDDIVSLKVLNIKGEVVAQLLNGRLKAGSHAISFETGKLSSGVYSYTLTTREKTVAKRMLLIK